MDLLPRLKPGSLIVSLAPHTRHSSIIPEIIAELALRGPVTVLDGGNCFPAYHVAQLIRRKSTQVNAISRRIFVQRAFTCYQIVSLLENVPALGYPIIILNLLASFQDEQIQPAEADRLLALCLSHIERLRLSAPVLITLEPVILAEKENLLKRVCERADEVFLFQPGKRRQEEQLFLFQGL